MPCGYGTLRTTAGKIWLRRGLSFPKNWLSYTSIIKASRVYLYNCKCFEDHLRLLLQSLKEICLAAERLWSIGKYLKALVVSTGLSWRLTCGFRTDLDFAEAVLCQAEWLWWWEKEFPAITPPWHIVRSTPLLFHITVYANLKVNKNTINPNQRHRCRLIGKTQTYTQRKNTNVDRKEKPWTERKSTNPNDEL